MSGKSTNNLLLLVNNRNSGINLDMIYDIVQEQTNCCNALFSGDSISSMQNSYFVKYWKYCYQAALVLSVSRPNTYWNVMRLYVFPMTKDPTFNTSKLIWHTTKPSTNWFEQSACAALWCCRQNVVDTIYWIFLVLSSSLLRLLFSQKGLS